MTDDQASGVTEHSNGSRVQLLADSRHVRRSHSRSERPPTRKATERSTSMSVSYHGAGKTRGSGQRGMGRYKSSGNMELESSEQGMSSTAKQAHSGSDGLGASTLHGKSSVSRIRDGSRDKPSSRSSSKSRGGATRAPLKRAMSNDNVLPPEASAGEARRGRRRPTKQQQQPVQQEDLQPSDDDDSFADDEQGETLGQISPLKPSSRRPTKQRRDLLVLLREKKTVQLNDFCECKDNRRVLHFLLYQHKLGVDLEDLQAQVDKAAGAPVARPIPPLYVEPT